MVGGHLFNEPEYHSLKGMDGQYYSLIYNEKTLARITFYREAEVAISGFQSPFGSFDFTSDSRAEHLVDLLSYSLKDLQSEGITRIIIKEPPNAVLPTDISEQALLGLGFKEESVEVNQYIKVDGHPFNKKITQKERNKLNRALSDGYEMRLLTAKDITLAFNLVNDAYSRKGFPVTMSRKDLESAYISLPKRYRLFGLFDGARLIATVASVIVAEAVMYNFYHADLYSYRARSPLVMLIGEVYNYCLEHKITVLDLGISSVDGKVNEGLFRFKENLGCLVSEKKTFTLDL